PLEREKHVRRGGTGQQGRPVRAKGQELRWCREDAEYHRGCVTYSPPFGRGARTGQAGPGENDHVPDSFPLSRIFCAQAAPAVPWLGIRNRPPTTRMINCVTGAMAPVQVRSVAKKSSAATLGGSPGTVETPLDVGTPVLKAPVPSLPWDASTVRR